MESPQATPSSPASLGPSSPTLGATTPGKRSRSSSRGSHLTLDLSNLPPLSQPATPTNTLLITNLQNPKIFHPENLQNIRNTIQDHANIMSWSPLKSLKRIVCSFLSEQEAILVRQALDGESIMGDRTRVYFGEKTPTEPRDQHLHAPESKKLFFISPPPSPPHGWEVKNEEPPNSQVLAEDLAKALAALRAKDRTPGEELKNVEGSTAFPEGGKSPVGRPRSGSTILFEPKEEDNNYMPAISVEDYSDSEEAQSPVRSEPAVLSHTARPPVELMH